MNETFAVDDKLGDIVVKFPQAAEIFKSHGIDFCCGGDQPLKEALEEHGVDGKGLLSQLNHTYDEARKQGVNIVDWSTVPLHDLIHHIVNTHHAYLRQTFPSLSELTVKILRVHGEHHGHVLSQVHRLFNQLRIDMEEHMIKEEEIVFPQVIAYESNPSSEKLQSVIFAIQELDREHDETGNIVKGLRRVTDNYSLPDDACQTFTHVYEKLKEVEADIFQHIHLENNVLFVHLLNDRNRYPVASNY